MLSDTGRVVRTGQELVANLGLVPGVSDDGVDALDISAGSPTLALDRDVNIGGDRTSPSPQGFEWFHALAPIAIQVEDNHSAARAYHQPRS